MFQYVFKLGILDETDSGLDIDALRIVANGVNTLKNEDNAFIIITHYQRLLDYIIPDFVHVLFNGKIRLEYFIYIHSVLLIRVSKTSRTLWVVDNFRGRRRDKAKAVYCLGPLVVQSRWVPVLQW